MVGVCHFGFANFDFFFVTWQSLKPKFVSAHRFSAKSDYLSLRYGDKTIIFKADADAAVVVAGHFFQAVACVSISWLHWMQSKERK